MYELFIATPEKVIFNAAVSSLIAPGTLGYLEILTDHAPIISTLTVGRLSVTEASGNKLVWALSGGVLEVFHNSASLLADAVELSTEIDAVRAAAAQKKAEAALKRAHTSHSKEIDMLRAKKALQRAKNRLAIAASA